MKKVKILSLPIKLLLVAGLVFGGYQLGAASNPVPTAEETCMEILQGIIERMAGVKPTTSITKTTAPAFIAACVADLERGLANET